MLSYPVRLTALTTMASIARPEMHLLLLPQASITVSWRNLDAQYGQALQDILQSLAKSSANLDSRVVLDVALPAPSQSSQHGLPRAGNYPGVQKLAALIYTLVCSISVKESIETEGPRAVDVRLVLLSDDGLDDRTAGSNEVSLQSKWSMPPTITTLALSDRPWQTVFSVDSGPGNLMLERFNSVACGSRPQRKFQKVGKGETAMVDTQLVECQQSDFATGEGRRHSSVAVGGTFDHLHMGHKLLLTMTTFVLEPPEPGDERARRLIVGISGDQLLKNKSFAEYLEAWEVRERQVAEFVYAIADFAPGEQDIGEGTSEPDQGTRKIVRKIGPLLSLECVELLDPAGPTLTDRSISALVVSAETSNGGATINSKRKEKGWEELEIFEVDVLDIRDDEDTTDKETAEDFASKISSTDIRRRISEKTRQSP